MEPTDTLLMRDKVINTTPARENDKFIKSSVDDFVPIPREFEVTSVSNYEYDMPTPSLIYRLTFRRAFRHPLPVPKVFNDPLGNFDSMSRSSKTSDLFEEIIAEFGLDDLIPTEIDDMYHDSEGDILYFEQFLNEDTSSDVSPTLLPTKSSSLVTPLPDYEHIYLREVERFDPFFSLTQSGGKIRVM
ncbi:hypothetical protein Tco_1526196 [Tanacetum coccineum]